MAKIAKYIYTFANGIAPDYKKRDGSDNKDGEMEFVVEAENTISDEEILIQIERVARNLEQQGYKPNPFNKEKVVWKK